MIGILWIDILMMLVEYGITGCLLHLHLHIPAMIWLIVSVIHSINFKNMQHIKQYHKGEDRP